VAVRLEFLVCVTSSETAYVESLREGAPIFAVKRGRSFTFPELAQDFLRQDFNVLTLWKRYYANMG
jgi:hypothetical protein